MTHYRVSVSELKDLLRDSFTLQALEAGGVDNWPYYGEAIQDYIEEWRKEFGLGSDEDWSIEDIAEAAVKGYLID